MPSSSEDVPRVAEPGQGEPCLAEHEPKAEFLDGWSLQPTRVRVRCTPQALSIVREDGQELASWSYPKLRCDAMQEGVIHVTHAEALHETLVVRDPALAQRLLSLAGEVEVLPGGRRKLRFALGCLGALAALGGGLYWAMPGLSRLLARQVSLEQERVLGAQLEGLLPLTACEAEGATEALTTLAQKLGGARFDVHIVASGVPNAFALPGGLIVVTDQLLEEAEDPDEIAGVLAHEIEHVAERHVLSGVIRNALLTGAWSVTVGDYAGLLVLDPSTAYRIANLEFSRADEEAADRGAITRLHRAGFSHRGLSRFFERLQERYGDGTPRWLSTHPSNESRIRVLEATPDVASPQPALSEGEFAVLHRGCDDDA